MAEKVPGHRVVAKAIEQDGRDDGFTRPTATHEPKQGTLMGLCCRRLGGRPPFDFIEYPFAGSRHVQGFLVKTKRVLTGFEGCQRFVLVLRQISCRTATASTTSSSSAVAAAAAVWSFFDDAGVRSRQRHTVLVVLVDRLVSRGMVLLREYLMESILR